jgi:hypothetical protein
LVHHVTSRLYKVNAKSGKNMLIEEAHRTVQTPVRWSKTLM